jgi:S-adenosylmethionine:tRNA ribosyltransferase-isomerase
MRIAVAVTLLPDSFKIRYHKYGMKTSTFSYGLPPERIAQNPSLRRGEDRLMLLDRLSGKITHHVVPDLPGLLAPGSLVVFNDSRVIKGRIFGVEKVSNKRIEFLLLSSIVDEHNKIPGKVWNVLVKRSKKTSNNSQFIFPDDTIAEVDTLDNGSRTLNFQTAIDDEWLDRWGHIPLPPYIRRDDTQADGERYQTVFAKETGSAAAPTAGLHFTREILSSLARRGIESAFITLHVGLGTFLPVRTENVEDHKMHTEYFCIADEAADKIEAAKREGRPVIACGTTSMRALESAWRDGKLDRGARRTNIFIYGGYQFRVANALFTNFHTPESSLLMLVAAFCGEKTNAERGRKMILDAYRQALDARYNFFSYGDAMLIC